jgi:hypothetical protein
VTGPADHSVLVGFCRKVYPGGPGWKPVIDAARQQGDDLCEPRGKGWEVPRGILNVFLGSIMIYSLLFMVGFWLYGNMLPAVITAASASISALFLLRQIRSG